MKTTGVIKIAILIFNVVVIFALPWPNEPDEMLTSPTIPFLFMAIVVPVYYLIVRKEKKANLKWPHWNTSLFNPDIPFGNVDFFGIMFASVGLAMIVSNKINYDVVSQAGLTSVSFGLGILFGLLMTLIIGKRMDRFRTDV
jgi:hypothetical protein